MLATEIIAVCSDTNTKAQNIFSEQNLEFLNWKPRSI
jgi:hypothetical protein